MKRKQSMSQKKGSMPKIKAVKHEKYQHEEHSNGQDSGEDSEEMEDEESSDDQGIMEDSDEVENELPSESVSPSTQPALKKMKTSKPPTVEEICELKETENQFQSSLFKLQIKELLSEVLLKSRKKIAVDSYIKKLKDVLMNLPSSKNTDLANQKWTGKGVIVPMHQQPSMIKGKFQFLPPTSVKVIGSYPLGTSLRPDVHVDLALKIPTECIHNKDFLNQRYLRKRALYLSVVAKHLKDSPLAENLRFTYHHGNHMKPILLFNPTGKLQKCINIRLHTCIDPGVFKLHRFHVAKNNVRRQWFFQEEDDVKQQGSEAEDQPATPVYNATMLQDMVSECHLEAMHNVLSKSEGLREGVTLCKVWLHQRRLHQGCSGFSGFLMTMFITHLVNTHKLNHLMSSFQILRNTLVQLAQADWTVQACNMAEEKVDQHRPTLQDFQNAYDVVFIDPTGYVNLCANLNKTTFHRVRHEASLSAEHLSNLSLDGFEYLFMTPVFFNSKFDHIVNIYSLGSFKQCVTEKGIEDELLDCSGDYVLAYMPHLVATLVRAVGKRCHLLQIQRSDIPEWSINHKPPSVSTGVIHIGLLVNPEFSNSIVERGPPADTVEAKSFQKFWGEKSELRRFQDGAICEAVVWSCDTVSHRRLLVCKMVTYILNIQAHVPKATMRFLGHEVTQVLQPPKVHNQKVGPYGSGEEQHVNLMMCYDDLCKQLRALDKLPLSITSLQGTSPVFRYAEVFPPMPARYGKEHQIENGRQIPQLEYPTPPYTPALKVHCLLENSGKWPEDHAALRRVKAAFHLQMANELREQFELRTIASPEHVDILKDGYVFRVEIGNMRELSLLKMLKRPDGMLQMVDTQASQELERRLVTLPKLTSTLHGLQQQHSCYCSAVRLAKRWIASQMMSDHIPEEAVELLMAYVFISPAPYTVPNAPLTGFTRLLRLLSTHDWKISPLIVNLNNEFSKEDMMEIQSNFTKQRGNLPLMYIVTPYDKIKSEWTRNQPVAPILHRLVILAQESLNTLQVILDNPKSGVHIKQIFRPPLDVYDVQIFLELNHINRHYQAVDFTPHAHIPKIQLSQERSSLPIVNYDAVQLYLKELKEAFGDLALFFYDPFGGTVIGVLWKPAAMQATPFKIGNTNCCMLSAEASRSEALMVPNLEAILEDFKVIGDGLVLNIERKTKPS